MKKALNLAGNACVNMQPNGRYGYAPLVVEFNEAKSQRHCGGSMREPYVPPVWPSARVSAADSIKAKGSSC